MAGSSCQQTRPRRGLPTIQGNICLDGESHILKLAFQYRLTCGRSGQNVLDLFSKLLALLAERDAAANSNAYLAGYAQVFVRSYVKCQYRSGNFF